MQISKDIYVCKFRHSTNFAGSLKANTISQYHNINFVLFWWIIQLLHEGWWLREPAKVLFFVGDAGDICKMYLAYKLCVGLTFLHSVSRISFHFFMYYLCISKSQANVKVFSLDANVLEALGHWRCLRGKLLWQRKIF